MKTQPIDNRLVAFDTTFRDGVQMHGVKATELNNALKAIRAIDSLGIQYHELGFASSNTAASARIRESLKLGLKGKVCAFGRTHERDVRAIIDLKPQVGVLVCKTRISDVVDGLNLNPTDYTQRVAQFVRTVVQNCGEAIIDGEHFFQAFLEDDSVFALDILDAAFQAGASTIVLCDTNGKMTPEKIQQAIHAIKAIIPLRNLGIHCHNDRGRAIANTEAAWISGIRHIQGTFGGFGERTGNADLSILIPNLVLDYQASGITSDQLKLLTNTYHTVCHALNVDPDPTHPYVGMRAFYTEAGMHEDGLRKIRNNYTHIEPEQVGNTVTTGVTEQSGRANLITLASRLGIDIPDHLLDQVNNEHTRLVNSGHDFGGAVASFELFLRRQLGSLQNYLPFTGFRISIKHNGETATDATLHWHDGNSIQSLDVDAAGDGPVDALNRAATKVVYELYPGLAKIELADFTVRPIDIERGSAAKVRVTIQFRNILSEWTTVGTDENMVVASWQALLDGYLYALLKTSSPK